MYIHTPVTTHLLRLQRLALPLPVIDVLQDHLGCGLGGILPTNAFDKVIIGV